MESDVTMQVKRVDRKRKMNPFSKASWTVFLIVLVAIVVVEQSAAEIIELDEYYRMPQIYDYDDYDRCVAEAPHAGAEDAVYCVARTVIKPDQESSLWRLIEHVTNDTRRNFRHDHLDRGFCVERCRQLVDSLDRDTADELFMPKFDIPFPYIINADAFTNASGNRERYGRLINICMNYALRRQYNLSAYTEIEYCTGPQRSAPIDGLDISFLVISALIVGLVIGSTWYDHHTSKQLGNEHYKKDLPCRKTMVLTSFSLVRNWYRLMSRSKDQLNEDLKFFQAIRFFTFCLVVVGHCGDLFTATSFANTYGREAEYSNPLAHILINGSLIVQSFFEMSGFLLSIHFCTNQAKMKKISWAAIFVTVAYRYIRLTPAYAYILLLHATWLPKLQDGPFWPRGAEVERNLCRRNWWTNLLYVNNYVNADKPYHRMPKLWKLDDYDECLQSPGPDESPGVYCANTVVIRPDNRSDLWRLIEDFSSDVKRNFNHAVLKRGVCIQRCRKTFENLSPKVRNELMVDRFAINRTYKFDETIFKNSATDRAMYEDMVEICINKELNDTYGLMGYTEVQSCDKSGEELQIDTLDASFLIIFCLLISFVILSSWYDSSINYKRNPEHYRQPLDSKRKMVLVSFSIQRNWYRLTSRSSSEMHQKLRFFQALRFLTMTLVVFGHAVLLLVITPTSHPEKLEMLMHDIGSMILTNGVQITQTFLAMSGTLLAIQFLDFAEQRNGRVGFLYVPMAIVIRYIRLTPVYAFVMLFHATWLSKLQVGPLWRWGSETEQAYCRRNWWTNLLYINNYVRADQPCVQQGWYLGAEFQIFIIAMIMLVTIVKFPRLKIAILAVVLTAAYTVPAIFIYYQNLDGTFVITLEAQRYILWFDRYYLQAYIPTHVNFGNYMLGVLTGLIYVELRKRSINLANNRTFRIVWYLNFLLTPLSMLPSYMFYVNEFDKPSVWMAVYFAVSKNLFGIGVGILFLGAIYRVNKVLLRLLNYPFFEPMGRLAYGAYLSHALVMRYMFVSTRSPVYFSDLLTISLVAGAVVLSCLVSLLLCLLIEFPTSALQGLLFEGLKARKTPNRVDPEDVTVADRVPASAPELEAKKTDL